MKNSLFIFLFSLFVISSSVGKAQSFSVQYDTVPVTTVNGSASIYDYIINHTSSPLTLNWHVVATNFPPDWQTSAALGLCDNSTCYYNASDGHGHSMQLWNDTFSSGNTFTTFPYTDTTTHGSFDMALNLAGATTFGSAVYYLTVAFYVPGAISSSQTMTFLVTKPVPSAVPSINNSETNISLYPNPASNELNVVYDAAADVKNIAIYNIIGKVMNVYKVTANNSANLEINNLPSGIYFVRLVNSHGAVVVTRKFTKQ